MASKAENPRSREKNLARTLERLEYTYRCLTPEQKERNQGLLRQIEGLRQQQAGPSPKAKKGKGGGLGWVLYGLVAGVVLIGGFLFAAMVLNHQ